jgi:cell wall-associated NlpC family hydrolase
MQPKIPASARVAGVLERSGRRAAWAAAVLSLAALVWNCAGPGRPIDERPAPRATAALPALRYAIQAGAFKNIDNAVRLTGKLLAQKLLAYHFVDESGFYKVRIGNFASREEAAERAERLKSAGVIEDYFILSPGDYAAAMYAGAGDVRLRQELLRTAERFIGVPYRWGGESTTEGFDCSGLTMVVYRLNGLDLPRTSAEQWRAGRPVGRDEMARGDLVFFATRGGRTISHVGIYIGGDLFLHAPRRGSVIQTDSLASDYYRARYAGARSYL